MSNNFLTQYRPCLIVLFCLGLFPYRKLHYQSRSYHHQYSTIPNRLILLILLITATTAQYYELMSYDFHSLDRRKLQVAIRNIESVTNTLIYCSSLLVLLRNGAAHADLLIGIQLLDDKSNLLLNKYKLPFENASFYRRLFWSELFVTLCVCALNASTFYMLTSCEYYRWNVLMMRYVFYIILCSFSAILMHMGNIARILCRRFERISSMLIEFEHGRIRHLSMEFLDLVGMTWKLKEKFEKIFGFIIVLNAVADSLLILITLFYSNTYGLKNLVQGYVVMPWTSSTYLGWPILRNCVVVWAMNGIGNEVCDSATVTKFYEFD